MFNEDERMVYEVRMQFLAEVESKIVSAMKKGLELGMKKGIEKGLEKGLKGGREEEKRTIARSLLDALDDVVIRVNT